MASYTYQVLSIAADGGERVHTNPGGAWTHETATTWAHTEGRHLPAGTRIRISRRRGPGLYQQHRLYQVSETGVTRRIDR